MKDTFYFPHDYEPTSDPKISAMIGVYGAVGYGLYWRIVEMMHSEASHRLPLKQYIFISLSKQMLTAVEQCSTMLPPVETVQRFVDDCIKIFELFVLDGEYFYSNRVNKNISKRETEKANKSNAGKASAEKRKILHSTPVEQTSTPVEQNPTKERKGKERIGENMIEKETKEEKYPFELFWNLYDKKVDRHATEKKYGKLTEREKEKIFQTLPTYIRVHHDRQYRKNPETYLNNKSWNDEYITPTAPETVKYGRPH